MIEFSPEWFDASSAAWRANKKRVGQSWQYKVNKEIKFAEPPKNTCEDLVQSNLSIACRVSNRRRNLHSQ